MKSRNNQRSANDDCDDEPFLPPQKAKPSGTPYPTPKQVERFSRQVGNQAAQSASRPSGVVPKPATSPSKPNPAQNERPTDEESRSLIQKTVSDIDELSTGGVLATIDCTGINKKAGLYGPVSFVVYRNNMLKKFGATEPAEIMMVDQLLMAQTAIGSMHLNVHDAKVSNNADAVAHLTSSVARLMAEFRKTAVALKQYQSPPSTPQYMLVQQQNVARGDQQIAFVENPRDSTAKKSLDSKVGSKPTKALTHEVPQQFNAKPEATDRREAESVPASRNNTRGTSTTPRRRPDKPTMAASHRSKDGRR